MPCFFRCSGRAPAPAVPSFPRPRCGSPGADDVEDFEGEPGDLGGHGMASVVLVNELRDQLFGDNPQAPIGRGDGLGNDDVM